MHDSKPEDGPFFKKNIGLSLHIFFEIMRK